MCFFKQKSFHFIQHSRNKNHTSTFTGDDKITPRHESDTLPNKQQRNEVPSVTVDPGGPAGPGNDTRVICIEIIDSILFLKNIAFVSLKFFISLSENFSQ